MATKNASYSVAPIPEDEDARVEELHALRLLDTASERRFDRYTSLVADLFAFPVVLVTLIDRDRQWFKSAFGLDIRETGRDVSFCAHAIHNHGVMVIPDAREDPRFSGNPLVTGHPHIRFYAGAVVHGPGGRALGTLCVIDHGPREFDETQCNRLRQFADLVENEIRHDRDLKCLRSSLEFSAYYDPLTNLPNRRLLTDRLSQLIELCRSDKRSAMVFLFNIPGLRLINQSYGSALGDSLLREMSDRLQACCPPGGTVARLQANEFVLTLPLSEGAEHIATVAYDIHALLSRPFSSDGREHFLDVRIGASMFPQHGATPAELIERASAAIRFARKHDQGGIRFFTEDESVNISEQVKIESRLRGAVERQSFTLVYQPIVSLEDGRLAAVEALLRWRDRELGNVSPGRFIPIAEQTGLSVPIGRWVLEETCRQLRQWGGGAEWEVPVAINVTARELRQPAFARYLLDRLDEAGIPPALLWVEVTEISLVSEGAVADANLALLSEASVRIAIDDFGTGYSSLEYLRRMPFSSLKIDRAFVSGLPRNKKDTVLTSTILGMAGALGMSTVGEGVEKKRQLEYLTNHGCQYAQGYLISRPVSGEKIPSMRGRRLI